MNKETANNILEHVSEFQAKAENILRYKGNPYVDGDSIAEHLSRLMRMVAYISPFLKIEFPEEKELISDIYSTLIIHDDDEIIDGFDIPTANKGHNIKDDIEIQNISKSVKGLGEIVSRSLVSYFSDFRQKKTLAAKIAKALDNLSGNQLVVEQQIGLINPDQAKFSIDYIEKVKGISSTIDALIESQVEKIVFLRSEWKANPDQVRVILSPHELSGMQEKALKLLEIDILSHTVEKSRVNTHLKDL